ncbi:hypothetical protein L483_19080 [Pseudomonas putida H8234]|nr:hypothetical protein L483_19080 [Pseudomonas putida H8234]
MSSDLNPNTFIVFRRLESAVSIFGNTETCFAILFWVIFEPQANDFEVVAPCADIGFALVVFRGDFVITIFHS